MGHEVTGSDQDKIYPPASSQLEEAGIPLNQPFIGADLVIVGAGFKSFSRCIAEYEYTLLNNIPHISATKYIARELLKENSIVVAGSFGKTTIAALMSHFLPHAAYFFGGQSVDSRPSLKFSDSSWSVAEGDESINGLDTKAKFLYYPVKYLILTSTAWEHKDSYDSASKNLAAYRTLISRLPKDGLLIYDPDDPDIKNLLKDCQCPSFPYEDFEFSTPLIGKHNRQNINAALTMCRHLGEDMDKITGLVSTFLGIKRRLEVLYNSDNIVVIDDFAQGPERINSALDAVCQTYPNHRIIAYFEPHASFLRQKSSIPPMGQAFKCADRLILGKIKFSAHTDKTDRVTVKDWQDAVGEKLEYIPETTNLLKALTESILPGTILIHFSSGGKEGLDILNTVVKNLPPVYNTL